MGLVDAPPYAAFFCEENVWWLAREQLASGARAEVAIVSNASRRVALWAQRAAPTPGEPVVWDYHVVLAVLTDVGCAVWDLDCVLGAPIPAARWIDASFPADVGAHLAPRFRVVEAAEYVRVFSSDRSHMRDERGGWLAPPPTWPTIGSAPPSLLRLLDPDDSFVGGWTTLDGLRARWCVGPGRAPATTEG